jgi:hypothetical protein
MTASVIVDGLFVHLQVALIAAVVLALIAVVVVVVVRIVDVDVVVVVLKIALTVEMKIVQKIVLNAALLLSDEDYDYGYGYEGLSPTKGLNLHILYHSLVVTDSVQNWWMLDMVE